MTCECCKGCRELDRQCCQGKTDYDEFCGYCAEYPPYKEIKNSERSENSTEQQN